MLTGGSSIYKGGSIIYKGGSSIYKGGSSIYKGGSSIYKGGSSIVDGPEDHGEHRHGAYAVQRARRRRAAHRSAPCCERD